MAKEWHNRIGGGTHIGKFGDEIQMNLSVRSCHAGELLNCRAFRWGSPLVDRSSLLEIPGDSLVERPVNIRSSKMRFQTSEHKCVHAQKMF